MLKDSAWIVEMVDKENMIVPFIDHKVVTNDVMSYGLVDYGYIARVSSLWRVIRKKENAMLDPKLIDRDLYVDFRGPYFELYPGACATVQSIETFNIPENVYVLGFGKVEYLSLGVIPNIQPLHEGYSGPITFSISNTQKVPIRLYAEEGIVELKFFDVG
jgi:dCTP deaminase